MQRLFSTTTILIFSIITIVSCSKTNLNNTSHENQISSSNAKPLVSSCQSGYYWDYYLNKCVPVCPPGYHNDSITGSCVINGAGTISVIANHNNPYDSAGSEHNNGVIIVFSSLNTSSNNLDSAILALDKPYVASLGYNSDSIQNYYNRSVQLGYLPFTHLQELDSLGNILYANHAISSYGNAYVQQIYNYANQYLNTDTINSTKYNSFALNLINLESVIKNDTRISSTEREVLLAGCSIGRYSAAYWGNYINGGVNSNSMVGKNGVSPLLFKKLRNWLRVVIADIGGAITTLASTAKWYAILLGAVGTSVATAATLDYSS